MPRKISLEEFSDMLQKVFGDDAERLVRGDALPINYLREKLGLVFSRDENGDLDITQL